MTGRIHAGCNVENAAYPVGTCAEAGAISAMIAAGETAIGEILVLGWTDCQSRRAGPDDALRRLPAAHPRVRRRLDAGPCRRSRRAASQLHARCAAARELRARKPRRLTGARLFPAHHVDHRRPHDDHEQAPAGRRRSSARSAWAAARPPSSRPPSCACRDFPAPARAGPCRAGCRISRTGSAPW